MSQIYEYIGVVEEIGQVQSFGMNGFTKREVIIGNDVHSESRYPNPVKFTFKKDNCSLLDGITQDQRVKIRFAIDGRRWEGQRGVQYFVDLTGLAIEALGADAATDEPPPPSGEGADVDDIPF